jgi:hypothetical protein
MVPVRYELGFYIPEDGTRHPREYWSLSTVDTIAHALLDPYNICCTFMVVNDRQRPEHMWRLLYCNTKQWSRVHYSVSMYSTHRKQAAQSVAGFYTYCATLIIIMFDKEHKLQNFPLRRFAYLFSPSHFNQFSSLLSVLKTVTNQRIIRISYKTVYGAIESDLFYNRIRA